MSYCVCFGLGIAVVCEVCQEAALTWEQILLIWSLCTGTLVWSVPSRWRTLQPIDLILSIVLHPQCFTVYVPLSLCSQFFEVLLRLCVSFEEGRWFLPLLCVLHSFKHECLSSFAPPHQRALVPIKGLNTGKEREGQKERKRERKKCIVN